MDKILNFQASIFGNFNEIKCDSDIITKFHGLFPDYQVNQIVVPTINVKTNQLIPNNRLQLVSKDKRYYITFLPERIDYSYCYVNGNETMTDFSVIQNDIIMNITNSSEILNNYKMNRLATNCTFLSKSYSKTDAIQEINKYSQSNILYPDSTNFSEWSIRYNARSPILINNREENSNNIVELSLSIDEQENFRIINLIDINTDPRNIDFRFSVKDLIVYTKEATKKIQEFTIKIGQ